MHESELHQVLGAHPELIEPAYGFLSTRLLSEGLRCDLLCEDLGGRKVYVEVKVDRSRRP